MGVRTICEHGYAMSSCRCPERHAVTVVACTRSGGYHGRAEIPVRASDVLNPSVLPPAPGTVPVESPARDVTVRLFPSGNAEIIGDGDQHVLRTGEQYRITWGRGTQSHVLRLELVW